MLFNAVIDLLEEQKLSYSSAKAESSGQNLVKMLTDCLWYIDGHHDSLKKQSCPVPPIFGPFTGYNVPERSKHRKRTTTNLSSDILKVVSGVPLFPFAKELLETPTLAKLRQ